jgi:hypothetical protein
MLSFNQLNGIFGLSNHPIVLIVEFLHPENVVRASLLGELQGLLNLLVCPLLEKEELLLERLRFLLQLLDGFFVSCEIKLGDGPAISKSFFDYLLF